MLQIEDASIAYGNDVLFSNFNLQLERGEIASISGSSGCGKTSLLNAILGFTPLKEGRITVNDIVSDKNSIDLIRKQIAWIPQELALPLEWVKDMVQLPFSLKANRATPFSERQLFNCFEELGLERELYYKRVNENIRRSTPTYDDSCSFHDQQAVNHCGRANFGTRFGLYGKSSCLFTASNPKGNRRTGGITRHGVRQRMRQTYNNVINLIKIKP